MYRHILKWTLTVGAVVLLGGCASQQVPCRDPAAARATLSQKRTGKFLTVRKKVPGEYIVVLKAPAESLQQVAVTQATQSLTAKYGGAAFVVYEHALRGFASRMSEAQARAMASDPAVDYVQENGVVSLFGFGPTPPAGLVATAVDGVPHFLSPHAAACLNRLAATFSDLFPFDGARCERMADRVIDRLRNS